MVGLLPQWAVQHCCPGGGEGGKLAFCKGGSGTNQVTPVRLDAIHGRARVLQHTAGT
jgi:hypothetical protein